MIFIIEFFKENIIHVLVLILLGLIFILWGRMFMHAYHDNACTMNLEQKEARLKCLAHYGWQVDETSETFTDVQIPDEFDNVYKEYNKLQEICGFDLEKFRGKNVSRYTYKVLNFPIETDMEIFINLLVYEGRLIGGDCMSPAINGFMLPLDKRFFS